MNITQLSNNSLAELLLTTNNTRSSQYLNYQPIHIIDGAALYKTTVNGYNAYLQILNLRKLQIDQLIGNVNNLGLGEGKYYQGEGVGDSPFFEMKLFSQVNHQYQQLYKKQLFSMINCAFFEQYKLSTQLSFPIKLDGQIITAGSSPYGPISNPKHKFYRQVQLKALVWNDQEAYITDYNSTSGAPLNGANVKNAIVSYQYSDHPAKVLANNQINRYHVISTLSENGVNSNMLLILTVKKATLNQAAALLRDLGARSDIITIDGGSSTYLFNSKVGNIMRPGSSYLNCGLIFRKLPHYLAFRTKD
ncbi:hypothetical protein DSM106972_065900 [Dulcicalothrix desertica PCC 7102]|uniref:Phosphodiester glycosidase domain-containing protein n=1 Tax=Dulcicalothrix desertica PCC 7102 TaxID=232991 RepID=A0A433V5V5_9CYAN|nr:hypothetical protein [Dulcicalothrix desertica]RUT01493.1 hypothetical protein DSM106972_065900 [Dulcicalothrix desertica PCC 7102]TWH43470.1 hypothetical protein CAL7102_07196 [Dulcicalothrix desertica PCC 7102]